MKASLRTLIISAAALLPIGAYSTSAAACGGFFCSTAQPVNQAAERIVFANNGDGTVTAVIQIQYEGPSKNFSWVLPISTAPTPGQIQVASNLAFQRLQAATNPQYTLNLRVEGTCLAVPTSAAGGSIGGAPAAASASPPPNDGNVKEEASGSVGPFDWVVVSVASGAAEPAEDAIQWLKDNGYDVPDSAPGLLGPYLEDGLFLLALRLTKGADTGSIRPLVLTYDAEKPIIPVKLTSVAANDDMGVMTWLLGDGRGVPENYRSLELNEARINWFNAATNYNSVVTDAANDAGGQGFVTEFAGDTSAFAQLVWSAGEEDQWQSLSTATYSSFDQMFNTFYGTYSSYDGFWDAIQSSVTFTSSVTFEDFKLCPSCYSDQVTFSPSSLVAALESNVIEPMRVIQDLIDSHPSMTRLYTTLSADEMTIDPLFTFNKDLPDVSNLHTADRVIECRPDISQFEAPWRIELPNGGVIRGTAAELNAARGGTWPSPLAQLPPNLSVLQRSSTGSGKVLEDNTAKIGSALAAYNSGMAPSTVEGDAGTGPNPGMTAGPASTTGSVSSAGMTAPSASTPVKGPGVDSADAGTNGGAVGVDDKRKDSGGCNVAAAPARSRASLGWLALGAVALLRRTRARTRVKAG